MLQCYTCSSTCNVCIIIHVNAEIRDSNTYVLTICSILINIMKVPVLLLPFHGHEKSLFLSIALISSCPFMCLF